MENHNILKGKKGIIFGALDERSIAWKTAEICFKEGANFVLTNSPFALRFGKIQELGEKCHAKVIPADVTSIEDLENLMTETKKELGNIDFILHSIGMSPNVRKKRPYDNLNYDYYLKTLDVSGISFHKIIQTAEKQDILNPWASIVALSYIASQRTFPDYSDMAQAKAVLESIARSYGFKLGESKNIRINTVSQSPTITRAGVGIKSFEAFLKYADMMSPLGNASAESCAQYIATLFSDYTRMVTMQNLMHDGGFSSSGVTRKTINNMS